MSKINNIDTIAISAHDMLLTYLARVEFLDEASLSYLHSQLIENTVEIQASIERDLRNEVSDPVYLRAEEAKLRAVEALREYVQAMRETL